MFVLTLRTTLQSMIRELRKTLHKETCILMKIFIVKYIAKKKRRARIKTS